jgi:hypothetical protein
MADAENFCSVLHSKKKTFCLAIKSIVRWQPLSIFGGVYLDFQAKVTWFSQTMAEDSRNN